MDLLAGFPIVQFVEFRVVLPVRLSTTPAPEVVVGADPAAVADGTGVPPAIARVVNRDRDLWFGVSGAAAISGDRGVGHAPCFAEGGKSWFSSTQSESETNPGSW